jgi:hypothetical protein
MADSCGPRGPLSYTRIKAALRLAECACIWYKPYQVKGALGRNGSRAPEGLEGAWDATADSRTRIGVSRLDLRCGEPRPPVLADRAAGSLFRSREFQECPDATSPITVPDYRLRGTSTPGLVRGS